MQPHRDRSVLVNAVLQAKPQPSPVFVAPQVSPDVTSPREKMSPGVTSSHLVSPAPRNGKTKPPYLLKPVQLAAARMYAKGGRTVGIAAVLKVHRRSVARWKLLPAFRAEIERVHRDLSQPPARPAPSPDLHANEREFLERVYTSAMRQFMKL